MKSRSAPIFFSSVIWDTLSLRPSIASAKGICFFSFTSSGFRPASGSAISGTNGQESLFLDLRHHVEQVPELNVPCLVESFQDLCPFLHFEINFRFLVFRHPEHCCD